MPERKMVSRKPAEWDQKRQAFHVPGEPMSIGRLVEAIEFSRRRRGITYYRIAIASGVSHQAVTRFFSGYAHDADRDRVADPDLPGRVRLDTALKIAQVCGLDFELVFRQGTLPGSLLGRSD